MKNALPLRVTVALAILLGCVASQAQEVVHPKPVIVRLDPRLDKLVPKNAVIEKIADGFEWVEGPVWDRKGGRLLFSDVPRNSIYEWREGKGASLFLTPTGYTGSEPFTGREPGSNGLAFDAAGRLLFAAHGDRRIARIEADGKTTTLADRYEGKRINSPNDLVLKSNGDLHFTDPPFGLPGTFDDVKKELAFQGVYRLSRDGKLTLLTRDLKAPNGIAFSPDEKTLYVSDSLGPRWMAFEVRPDGTLANGHVLLEGAEFKKNGAGVPDGLKVDAQGNIFGAGPGGIYVIAPDGTLLGRFDFGVATGNCAWGEDGSTLFITSNHAVYRIRLTAKGTGF